MSNFRYYDKLPQNDFPPECLCKVILREAVATGPPKGLPASACMMFKEDVERLKPLTDFLDAHPDFHTVFLDSLRAFEAARIQ